MRKLMLACLALGFLAGAAFIAWAADAATVRIVKEDVVLLLTFKDRSTLKVTSRPTRVKPGEYEVKKINFYKQDEDKKTWEIRCEKNYGTLKMLMIAPGQDKIIDPGPPLRLKLYVRQGKGEASDTYNISLSVVGRYNEVYDPWAYKPGDRKHKPRPPVVIIKDPAGEVLKKAVMEVTGTTCRYHWKFGDRKGNFTLDFDMDLGPFELVHDAKKEYVIE